MFPLPRPAAPGAGTATSRTTERGRDRLHGSGKWRLLLRSTDIVARLRDGIAILLLDTPDADAARVTEHIRAHIENVSFQSDPAAAARRVTLSMGIKETVRLSRAQSRLKGAADRGGNQVVASDSS